MHSSPVLIWSCPLLSEHSVSTLKFSYSLSFYFLFLYICFLSRKYYCLISMIWYWVLIFLRCFSLFTFFYNWILFHFFSLQIDLFLFPHFKNILEKVLNIQKELHWMTTTLACTTDQNTKLLPWFWKMVTNYDRNDTVSRLLQFRSKFKVTVSL